MTGILTHIKYQYKGDFDAGCGGNPTTCQEYRGDKLVLQDNQEYRVAEGDVEDIHEWRQPEAVDRCWVCVGVCGQGSFFLATQHTHPYFCLLLYDQWSPVTLAMLFLLPKVSEGGEEMTG